MISLYICYMESEQMDIEYQEVLYNACYGGYGFSEEFNNEYNKRHPSNEAVEEDYSYGRTNPHTIQLFKEMGPEKANSDYSDIKIAKIPKELLKHMNIDEYDGFESISVDYKDAFSDLMKETYKTGQLTDEIKRKYERLLFLKSKSLDPN